MERIKIIYYCPNHPDVVLGKEEKYVGLMKELLTVSDKPFFCRKCKKYYFKYECEQEIQYL